MVNIKEHNEKVNALELSKSHLDAAKPKVIKKLVSLINCKDNRMREFGIVPDANPSGIYDGDVRFVIEGDIGRSSISIERARAIAASIIAFTGPITPKELDAVVIE